MPIVSVTLSAGQSATWLLTGSGFTLISSGGALLSRIEFLRLGKVVEDLIGQFGDGFYFTAPDGTIFDGVRITALNSGTFAVFIGYGVAGMIETAGAREVNVTNSALAVDVQNTVLNANITNSAIDIDIAAQTVELQNKRVGSAGSQVGPNAGSTLSCTTASSLSLTSTDVVEIDVSVELYLTLTASCPANAFTLSVIRVNGGATIFSKNFGTANSELCNSHAANTYKFRATISDAFSGTTQYRIVGSGGVGSPTVNFQNANIRATK